MLATQKLNDFKPDRKGPNNSFFGKTHSPETIATLRAAAIARVKPNKPGYEFTVVDTLLNTTTKYPSIRKGIEAMG